MQDGNTGGDAGTEQSGTLSFTIDSSKPFGYEETPAQDSQEDQSSPEEEAEPLDHESDNDEAEDEGESDDKPKRKPNGYKQKIERLRAELARKDVETQELRSRYEPQAQSKPADQVPAEGRPNPNDAKYQSEDGSGTVRFFADDNAWVVQDALAKRDAETKQTEAQRTFETKLNAVEADLQARAEPEVWENIKELRQSGLISDTIREAIVDSPVGADLAIHLAEYPDTLRILHQVTPREFYKIIGQLEAGIAGTRGSKTEKVAERVTRAEPPLNTVKGKASTGAKSPTEMTQAEFEKWMYGTRR